MFQQEAKNQDCAEIGMIPMSNTLNISDTNDNQRSSGAKGITQLTSNLVSNTFRGKMEHFDPIAAVDCTDIADSEDK